MMNEVYLNCVYSRHQWNYTMHVWYKEKHGDTWMGKKGVCACGWWNKAHAVRDVHDCYFVPAVFALVVNWLIDKCIIYPKNFTMWLCCCMPHCQGIFSCSMCKDDVDNGFLSPHTTHPTPPLLTHSLWPLFWGLLNYCYASCLLLSYLFW